MAIMASYAAELWELEDQSRPDPTREDMEAPALRPLAEVVYQSCSAHYPGTCAVCGRPILRGQSIRFAVADPRPRRQWHLGCDPAVQDRQSLPAEGGHVHISHRSTGTPAQLQAAPALPVTLPAAGAAAMASLMPVSSGDREGLALFPHIEEQGRPFCFSPLAVVALVGAPGRRMTVATLTLEVPCHVP